MALLTIDLRVENICPKSTYHVINRDLAFELELVEHLMAFKQRILDTGHWCCIKHGAILGICTLRNRQNKQGLKYNTTSCWVTLPISFQIFILYVLQFGRGEALPAECMQFSALPQEIVSLVEPFVLPFAAEIPVPDQAYALILFSVHSTSCL
jgi:hypothetical protein